MKEETQLAPTERGGEVMEGVVVDTEAETEETTDPVLDLDLPTTVRISMILPSSSFCHR